MSGYEQAKMRLDESFQQTKERIANTIRKHGDKSAYEMVQRENVQEAKNNPLNKDLK
jgi:dissimilatory sulfite reductase (desulfoviridin) alpha/beta subunit